MCLKLQAHNCLEVFFEYWMYRITASNLLQAYFLHQELFFLHFHLHRCLLFLAYL